MAEVVVVHGEDQADQRRKDALSASASFESPVANGPRSKQAQHHDLGAVPGCRSERATRGDQRPPDRFLPEQDRHQLSSPCAASRCDHAATPWAPPTAEQIGLIGTNWSKGWIIENNVIRYSICSGIALGKYGDEWDNTSPDSAEGYVDTIERALKNGWNKETIGSHIVRNNHISHCEQTGIVGSLGCAFSTITGNNIHDIHVRRLFSAVRKWPASSSTAPSTS